MVELEGLNIRITTDKEQAVSGIKDAKQEMASLGTEAEKTSSKVQAAGVTMNGSFKQVALGFSQTATSAFSLYQSFDNIEKKQYALEKANLASDKATKAVAQAQSDYNALVAQYGADSEIALLAYEQLQMAQESERLAIEKVDISQGNLNDSMTMAALTVIPATISGIDGIVKVWKNLQGLDLATSIGRINEVLAMHRTAIISAGAGLAAVAVIYGAFTTTSQETRVGLSLLAGGLVAAAAAQWVWNAATAFGLGLTGAGLALVAVAGVAAATVYALSSKYGAEIEEQGVGSSAEGVQGYGTEMTAAKMQEAGYQWDAIKSQWYKPGSTPGYASGGISTFPQLATISEGEPEIHLTRANIAEFGLGGTVNNFYIDGAKDVDRVADGIARKLSRSGI